MRRFATWITGHRKTVIVGWILALIVIGGVSGSVGADFTEEFKLPASDSKEAFDSYRDDPELADLHAHRENGASSYVWHLFDRLDDLRPLLKLG